MLENASRWPGNGSRLVKARSSPNVSKPLSLPKKQASPEQAKPTSTNKPRTTRPVTTSKPIGRTSSNDQINRSTESTKTRVSSTVKPRRTPETARGATTVSKNEKKPVSKSISSSCTILEDRALLKKGLSYTPAKPPKKPEALKKKAALDRSVSLGCVSTGSSLSVEKPKQIVQEREAVTKKKSMNRSTSLWSVQTVSRSEHQRRMLSSSRPSRIPLLAQRNIRAGRSLADLSQVDRAVELHPVFLNDIDLDRSMDERIYENCREAFNCSPNGSQNNNSRTYTSNLEERVARLMAQLEDDVDNDEERGRDQVDSVTPPRSSSGYEAREIDSKGSGESKIVESGEKYTATVIRIEGSSGRIENSQKIDEEDVGSEMKNAGKKIDRNDVTEESKKKKEALSIQELRKNWEKQATGSQKPIRDSISNVTPVTGETAKPCQRNNRVDQSEIKNKQSSVGKRAKEIEHLVNFFNCKNAETSSKDPWVKRPTDATIEALKKSDAKNINDYNGYSSDGNCSEDSGHMSNENEVEWKEGAVQTETVDFPNKFDARIAVFDATSINCEKKPAVVRSNASTSSGASSISSCREEKDVGKEHWKARRPYDDSQIFFRSGTLERLEAQRDEKLTGHIILLQARCRGYLARRKLNTLKLQDLAVRCIQRNVRKWMSVREWPWWRLYVKIAPLLNVHRREDQLKAKTEEVEILRAKVEKLEQERTHLKHDNDRLEAKLSEMTADFAEEHSTSTLAAERIDAETSERLRLERELQDVTEAHKNLQQTTERLEMELLYARAADLNGVASDAEDGEDGGVYKQRYEHAVRELEFTKRKMAQQHEDDLEQLVGLKKQLEKKLADAYEEVEEQRQVVGQWKRRVQKLNGEMHDLRLLLEEQTARNNLLEKKQRKFDSETQNLMNDLRQEKTQRERLAREKEIAIAEKFTIEQNLSDARLEIELKEERLRTLSQELEELTFGGKTEEEVAQLKKAKHELEKRTKDQEEELDDLAGQVQLLEQAKLRLEMSIEQQRKEMRKEMQQRDEELEDVRGNALKKVKALELQLENEHEERTILLREKHELERRLVAIEEQDRVERAAEADTMHRLKRDLKRTKALLRDAQTMLERSKGDSTGKAALRQLKNQLEDAECARAVAVKAKQALEQELNETQASLEEAQRQRSEAEDRANVANRERTELLSQLEENEEELAEVLKKYRAAVQQVSAEQAQLQEAQVQIAALEAEKSSLKDQLSELSQRLESVEQLGDPTANSLATRRLEFRAKELESKLELEQTTRARLETQIARLKENLEKLQTECALLRTKEQNAQDASRRLQRSLREARDEASSALAREQESTRARRELEKSLEAAEAETKVARDDLRLALQRIDDLQSAIQGELELDCSEEGTTENSDSD
ncbi:unconventional myosin-XVIIIa isoform X2 [Ceratina calcarata]|uniref:Unconventional myosin-XVIIIa isoform X2 n=1 Tax=Ceratina calcarata TaxID=156304 RepID=A0AAJ7WA39_9HYME|nr:unconventional myosin-XVIIIa isoform X2 [Ceratina calcarata]XP_026667972.1 unconventional myosin-XVIIIa isoform X2 [Ceratina calcarata]XP_026667973.1 unconventional myosin-XVIIIa isoform X2 [Ceratina calcarata]